jgi:hypothetical protein
MLKKSKIHEKKLFLTREKLGLESSSRSCSALPGMGFLGLYVTGFPAHIKV